MSVKIFGAILILGFAVLIGCEGETGPAGPAGADGVQGPVGPPGPSTILAFGDIDYAGPSKAFSYGPRNLVDTVLVNDNGGGGGFDVSCVGTFTGAPGTLILATSSDDAIVSAISVSGNITSWADTLIRFRANTFNTQTHALDADDFSFVIFGE